MNEDFNGCPKPPRHRWREKQPFNPSNRAEEKREAWLKSYKTARENKSRFNHSKEFGCADCLKELRADCAENTGYERICGGAGCEMGWKAFKRQKGVRK